MEADCRPFQSVNIAIASVETGQDRFVRDDIYRPPPHAAWRCNLTALSQRFNLYFMASRESIAVYQPDFPLQKLGRLPKLLIPPALAEPRAQGYLDQANWPPGRHPHSINHLCVGDLGSEEILLLSTDSGNIAAYHTKAVYEAMHRDPYRFSSDGRSDLVGLRCFFSQWVQESAWGLAIHKEARMIAVSANMTTMIRNEDPNAKITVFAFALSGHGGRLEDDDEQDPTLVSSADVEWHHWNPRASPETVPKRDRNYKIVLGGEEGHSTNIPSISFVNTKEDPDGSWLLSCDIHGETKCWQIWRGTRFATWDFAETSDALRRRRQRRSDGGWMVAALDPDSFRPTSSMESFCGHKKVPQYYGHLGTGDSYDITNVVRLKTPGRSQRHPLHPEDSEDDENDTLVSEEVAGTWSSDDSDGTNDARDLPVVDGSDPHFAVLDGNSTRLPERPQRSETLARSEHEPGQSEDLRHDSIQHVESEQIIITPPDFVEVSRTFDPQDLFDIDSNDEAESESEGDDMDVQILSGSEEDSSSSESNLSSTSISNQTQRTSVEVEIGPPLLTSSPEVTSSSSGDTALSQAKSLSPNKRSRQAHFGSTHQKPMRIPFIPTLHLSQSHLRMINLPQSRSPHIFCANILKQDLPEVFNHTHYSSLQRLNMLQQIPELGIVIVASQLGRAAVCSLTKYVPNGTLGLRVDWILPTRRQEKAQARPPQNELLGIAVAPIQGRLIPSPDPDNERDHEPWARDRVIDGVDTTFDDRVVVLSRPRNQNVETSSEDESPRQRAKQRPSKRKKHRSFSSLKSSSSSAASTEQRPWPAKPKQEEDWQAVEGTRRYRLMMTYSDMTVLTYEIGRGVERDDVAVCLEEGVGEGIGVDA